MGADGDFAAAAEQLYGVPATMFIAERNARANDARAAGDRDLAARISALPKPSAAAILVNRFVRDDGDALDGVLELGAALRAAQEGADRDALRTLGARRRDLLTEVTRAVGERAEHPPGAAVLEEFQQTIRAALISEDAAAAVRTGRLVHALRADGLDPVDLTNAVGGPGGAAPAPSSPRKQPPAEIAPPSDDTAARAELRTEAERLAADADRRADEARRAADRAATAAQEAATLVERRERAAADLEARIEQLRDDLRAAEADLGDARDASAAGRAAAAAADAASDRAAGEADTARAAARDAAEALRSLHD